MLPPETVEELPDQIGERLQQARERAGLTVDDVIFKTRIPRSVVEALEAANFSVFSSPTYAKSFLAQYSGFLGVEAGVWLDALQPASFVSGETVSPLWAAAQRKKEERGLEPVAGTSGRFSAVVLLGVSCAVVLAAIKGYEFFDKRFGSDLRPSELAAQPAGSLLPVPAATALPAEEERPLANTQQDDFTEPAPRAIIVRP